jgi:hypothetical protein
MLLPKFLKNENDRYLMELHSDGYYRTQMPETKVPKIGVTKPKKKKFTYQQLIDKGYK